MCLEFQPSLQTQDRKQIWAYNFSLDLQNILSIKYKGSPYFLSEWNYFYLLVKLDLRFVSFAFLIPNKKIFRQDLKAIFHVNVTDYFGVPVGL